MTEISVTPFDRLALAFAPRPWAFAEARRVEIDAHFSRLKRETPALWNGRVLLMHGYAITGREFEGRYLETDFASFLAWRDWGFPDAEIRNCFALGALLSSDDAFLLGIMAGHTANAGRIYFPGGTPEPADIVDDKVDLESSVFREVAEETGLAAGDLDIESGWHAVLSGPRIAMMKIMRSRDTATALRDRIRNHLASEKTPELSDIRIARGIADLDPRMPDFVTAFLRHRFGALAKDGTHR
ncbi:MAG: NUDIX hydrolase [Rhizobiales bacterium]|nr:NUDIX hydrolase [Hyphomicrobiales bacterium]